MKQAHKLHGGLIEIDWEQGELIEKHEYGADYAITGIDEDETEYESTAYILGDEWDIDEEFLEGVGCSNEIDPDDVRRDREALAELNNPYKI